MKSDLQATDDGVFELDWLALMLSLSRSPKDRLKYIIFRVANQLDAKLEKLGYEVDQVIKLREWLEVLAIQAHRAKPRYKRLLVKLDDELVKMTIARHPRMLIKKRKLNYQDKPEYPTDLAAFAFVVGEAFNSDLYKRVGRCPECQRRIDKRVSKGKPVDPNKGPYFVRDGIGDNRIYCGYTHLRTWTMRNARERKRLQTTEQVK